MKSPTAVTHDDMTDLQINLKYWVSRHKRFYRDQSKAPETWIRDNSREWSFDPD